jgi:formiminoglutamase
MTELATPQSWSGTSSDPNDEQFGHVVETATLEDVDDYRAVIVGEPYDGAVIGRKGASEGPAALRDALAATKSHHFSLGPVRGVADLGDVVLPDTDSVAEAQAAVGKVAAAVHDSDTFPVFLGGDNSLTYANVRPLMDHGSVGVLNFDAHLDVREVRESEGPTSGTPYRQLIEDGLDAYAAVGARHFETSSKYHQYVRDNDGVVHTAGDVREDPIGVAEAAIESMAGVDSVYVSVDLDVLDATAAPGVSAPTPGGLTTRELFRMLRHLGKFNRVAGFEIVECAPPLDSGDRTARAGARAIAHHLAERVTHDD